MEPKNQKNVSLLLLVSLLLQSCGVDVPRELEDKQVSGEELANPVTQNGTKAHGFIETCGEQDICTQSALSGATHVFDASKEPEIASVHRLSDQEIMQEEGDKAASQLLELTSKRLRLDMGASSETRPDTAVNLPPKALVSAMKKWLSRESKSWGAVLDNTKIQ